MLVSNGLQGGLLLLTNIFTFGTTAIEAADMGWWINRAAGCGFAQPTEAIGLGSKAGNGGDKRLSVGMAGVVEDGVGGAGLNEFAEVHN